MQTVVRLVSDSGGDWADVASFREFIQEYSRRRAWNQREFADAAGVPLKTVAARLGHSSIAITADLYGHTRREDQVAAADALEGAFSRERDRAVTEIGPEGQKPASDRDIS